MTHITYWIVFCSSFLRPLEAHHIFSQNFVFGKISLADEYINQARMKENIAKVSSFGSLAWYAPNT